MIYCLPIGEELRRLDIVGVAGLALLDLLEFLLLAGPPNLLLGVAAREEEEDKEGLELRELNPTSPSLSVPRPPLIWTESKLRSSSFVAACELRRLFPPTFDELLVSGEGVGGGGAGGVKTADDCLDKEGGGGFLIDGDAPIVPRFLSFALLPLDDGSGGFRGVRISTPSESIPSPFS